MTSFAGPYASACSMLQCCLVNFFAELLELLAGGATMMAAVTGEGFIPAARHLTGMVSIAVNDHNIVREYGQNDRMT